MFLSRRRDGDSNGGLIIAFDARIERLARSELRIYITQQCCSSRDYDSNGRLDDEIGGVDGDATPSLAESIGKFWFTSRQLARLVG